MSEFIKALRPEQRGELYFELVRGLIALVNGDAEDSGVMLGDHQAIHDEIVNAIDIIRRATGEI